MEGCGLKWWNKQKKNRCSVSINVSDYQTDVYIPVLDDPIDHNEVSYVIHKQLNANKSSCIDGLSPGLFKRLPLQ